MFKKVTNAEATYVMQCIRLQAQSTVWFEHRKGRLTTSRFGAIRRTSVDKSAKSLVVQLLQRKLTAKSAALTCEIEESKDRLGYEGVMKPHTPLSKWRALNYTSIQSTHILVLHLMGSQTVPAVVMGFSRLGAIIVCEI